MLKKLALAVAAAFIGMASPALAQNPQTVKLCVPTSTTACPVVTASAPLPVTGTFSATLAGFTPNGSYTTLTATAASSASTNLPSGTVVAFQNLSTVDVSCVLTAGASTATTNKLIVRGGATVYYTVGSNTTTACINQTGSASNVVGLAGGSGLGTAFGGGGGGGGTVVQGNAGSNAQAWWTRIGDATNGPAKVQAGNSAATTDVALTVADPNVLAAINAPIPACSASPCTTVIGGVVLYQGTTALSTTNGIYSNLLFGNAVADTNSGNKSAATQRNVLATDQLALATWGHGATGAAAPSGATQFGATTSGATGGFMKGLIQCDNHVFKHITSATDTLAVQGVASQTIYICGWRARAAGVATWYLENTASTNANCSSTLTQITGVATEAANTGEVAYNPIWGGLKNTSGNGLCINSTGTGGVDIDIWYTQF